MAFLVLHTVTTIPAWDRYLLPLAAVFALLVGWLVSRVLTGKMVWVILLLWSLLLLPPAVQAATGQLPIGGDHGAYSGLSEALAWVQQVPGQRVLYQRNLSWQTNFYLYNELYAEKGRRTLTVRWISNSVALVDNVHNNPVGRKFVLLPTWSPLLDLPRFAQMQGVIVYTHRRFGNFSLYELQTRPRPYCNWCRCVEKKHWLTVLPFARGKRGFN